MVLMRMTLIFLRKVFAYRVRRSTNPASLDLQGVRDFFLLYQSFHGFRVASYASLYWIEIPKKRVKFMHGLRTEKRGPKPPPLSFRDVFVIPGQFILGRVLVVEKCV